MDPNEKYFYEGGIELDIDGLIIDGNGHTIDGCDNSRIFFITGKNIILKNITFKNGHSFENFEQSRNSNGGALKIYPNSNLKIENCRFIDNTSERNGGAIDNHGELTIVESTLNNNSLKPFVADIGNVFKGCAVHNAGKLDITNTILNNNYIVEDYEYNPFFEHQNLSVSCYGGALFNDKRGYVSLTDVTLNDNNSTHSGAIENKGIMNIIQAMIKNNKSNYGIAIRNDGDLMIRDSTIKGTIAKYDSQDQVQSNSNEKKHFKVINCIIE